MGLTEHVTLNFNNNIITTAVILDIERDVDATRHSGLLYKLYKLKFLTNWIKLISCFFSERKFTVSVEGEMPTQSVIQVGVPQGSVLFPTLCGMYINDSSIHDVFTWLSFQMTLAYMPQFKRRVVFSERCSAVSVQLGHGVSAGTLKSMKISLRPSTLFIDLGPLMLIWN
jgi:hypothetical protein